MMELESRIKAALESRIPSLIAEIASSIRSPPSSDAVPEDLRFSSSTLDSAAISPSTRRSYTTSWRIFERFWSQYFGSRDIFAPSDNQVKAFVAYMFKKGYSPNSVSCALSSVAFFCKERGNRDPTRSETVQRSVRGLRNIKGSSDTRSPVSVAMLRTLLQVIDLEDFSSYDKSCFKSIFSIAFFGLFRISEVVGIHRLLRSDVQIVSHQEQHPYITIKLRSSKTNQSGRVHTIEIKSQRSHPASCPVLCLKRFLELRTAQPSDPLFVFASGVPVSQSYTSRILKRWCKKAGFQENISFHSFRIGGATEAFRQGFTELQIMSLGRWNSDSFRRYVRPFIMSN